MSVQDHLLTIEEAATQLGVSVATARRMAADGRIRAHKSGKQWLVEGSSLIQGPASRRRRAVRPSLDLARALAHVRTTDLTEVWVPDVLQQEDLLADPAAVLSRAQAICAGGVPGPRREVEVDKSPMLTRWATLLALEDRVAYQAVVGSFADRVDARTAESVFSARLSGDTRYFTKRSSKQWVAWRRFVRVQLGEGDRWLAKTDLTSYFDTIPHIRLLAEVAALNVDVSVLSTLRDMLRSWGSTDNAGLPQGPNASRILGNLYMLPVDRAMLDAGWEYSRFQDDVRIVVDSKTDGFQAIRQFQQECRTRGLLVSSAKTRLLHGKAARDDLEANADLERAQYLTTLSNSKPARSTLKAILRSALKSEAGIDERRARFSLWRLTQLRDDGTLGLVLRRLEDLAPIATVVAAYLRPFIRRSRVVEKLASFLVDPARSQSPYLCTWLFAAMLEHPGTLPASWADEAARRVKNRNEPEFLRAVASVVMLRGGRPTDIRWIKSEIGREHDPEVLRGYAVGLHWTHELDKNTQRRLASRGPGLPATVAYLQGRNRLPSLVSRTHVRID